MPVHFHDEVRSCLSLEFDDDQVWHPAHPNPAIACRAPVKPKVYKEEQPKASTPTTPLNFDASSDEEFNININ